MHLGMGVNQASGRRWEEKSLGGSYLGINYPIRISVGSDRLLWTMLAIASSALAFNAPLLPARQSRSSAVSMQEKSQAIPFLDKPPALDGAEALTACRQAAQRCRRRISLRPLCAGVRRFPGGGHWL